VADEELEQLRNAYRALGPGFPAEAQSLFSEDAEADGGDWCVKVFGKTSRCLRASELATTDLFALPGTWEVTRAEVRRLTYKRGIATVTGFMYCRPRGSWENMRIPLLHVWTMRLGKALRFENLLDGIELSRVAERRVPGAA
jgi:hypothetical protein